MKIMGMALMMGASATMMMAQPREKTPDKIDYYNYLAYRCHEKGDKAGAAKNFLLYLEEPQKRGMTQAQQDSLYMADRVVYDQAAVNAMFLFYSVGDMDGVLKTLPYGRRTSKPITNVYLTSMEAAKEKGMNDLYLELLREAITKFPDNSSFVDKMMEYYTAQGDSQKAQAGLDELIAQNPKNAELWYAKGVMYFNDKDNPNANTEARTCFSKAIALDEEHAEACAAMGNTYIRDVVELRRKGMFASVFSGMNETRKKSSYQKDLAEVQTYYFNAQTYLRMAKALKPDAYDLWGEQLLECYKILGRQQEYEALKKEMQEE